MRPADGDDSGSEGKGATGEGGVGVGYFAGRPTWERMVDRTGVEPVTPAFSVRQGTKTALNLSEHPSMESNGSERKKLRV